MASGILITKRSSVVSTIRLTRMLVPNPKKAFQSPGTQIFGLNVLVIRRGRHAGLPFDAKAERMRFESETHPKIPPWALIIRSPTS